MLEKFRIKIEKTKFDIVNKKKINITISIGAVSSKKLLDKAVSNADKNLYIAKETGRNKLVGQ